MSRMKEVFFKDQFQKELTKDSCRTFFLRAQQALVEAQYRHHLEISYWSQLQKVYDELKCIEELDQTLHLLKKGEEQCP